MPSGDGEPARLSRKQRGYDTQREVADHLKSLWPLAESAGAGRPGRDVVAMDSFSIEVKAQANVSLPAFIRQSSKEAEKRGEIPVMVLRLNGQGPATIGRWPVVMLMDDWMELIRKAGYGVPEAE